MLVRDNCSRLIYNDVLNRSYRVERNIRKGTHRWRYVSHLRWLHQSTARCGVSNSNWPTHVNYQNGCLLKHSCCICGHISLCWSFGTVVLSTCMSICLDICKWLREVRPVMDKKWYYSRNGLIKTNSTCQGFNTPTANETALKLNIIEYTGKVSTYHYYIFQNVYSRNKFNLIELVLYDEIVLVKE